MHSRHAHVGNRLPPADADARFEHFKRSLWPRIKESGRGGGHLIYLPSYFDYVRWGWEPLAGAVRCGVGRGGV